MSKTKPLPEQELLKEFLTYDQATGLLRRIKGMGPRKAFTSKQNDGYCHGWFKDEYYLAHRIIWKWMTGDDPEYIDHINGDPSDNRWVNLRSVPDKINQRNSKFRKDNTSGRVGVYNVMRNGVTKYQASIGLKGKLKYLGFFDTFDEALAAREKAEEGLGFTQRHAANED